MNLENVHKVKKQMIPNAYWVYPKVLLAGAYPASPARVKAIDTIRWLLAEGVNSFLDLTEPGEYGLLPYKSELEKISLQLRCQVEFMRFPVRDMEVPPPGLMSRILDSLDQWISENRTIYLHCYGGKGRTGTVVGCHLVRHGWDGEAALLKIKSLRSSLPDASSMSPETLDQINLVRNWSLGQ